jgi:hypothetical protein
MKTKKHTHTTLDGRELVYAEPSAEVGAFLDRVFALLNDPRATDDEMIELIYGAENPLTDKAMFPGRGAVTREVFANPIYQVLVDWLVRKQKAMGKVDVDAALEAATLSVPEAAAELGMTPSAVRQAIRASKLPAVKRGRGYFLAPHDVATFAKHRQPRGPTAAPMLEARVGSVEGKSFRIKALGSEEVARDGRKVDVVVATFKRVAVVFSGELTNKLFVLEPSEKADEFRFGPFYVRGRFRVVERVNDPKAASQRWKAFEAA